VPDELATAKQRTLNVPDLALMSLHWLLLDAGLLPRLLPSSGSVSAAVIDGTVSRAQRSA
jgi:hypothetical protein